MTACARLSFVLCVLATGCGSTSGDLGTARSGPVDGGVGTGGASTGTGGTGAGGAPNGGRAAGGVSIGSGGIVVGAGGATVREASVRDASADVDARTCGSAQRVPQRHRAQPETCPSERGSQNPNTASCADTSGIVCKSDADCTAGMNGRCFLNGDPCRTLCSYDDCLTDADCPSGQPCTCRASGTETSANRCVVGSSCATDANCECGFCSLSVQHAAFQCSQPVDNDAAPRKCSCIGVTSEAYACHTMTDECTDDSDCRQEQSAYCAYVSAEKRWACTTCKSNGFR